MNLKIQERKKNTVSNLRNTIISSSLVIISNYSKLTSNQMNALRKAGGKCNVNFKIVKNTLAKLAFKETNHSKLCCLMNNSNILLFSNEDEVIVSKFLKRFKKSNNDFNVKAISISSKGIFGSDHLDYLSGLPNYNEVICNLVFTIKLIFVKLLKLLLAPYVKLTIVLNELLKKKTN